MEYAFTDEETVNGDNIFSDTPAPPEEPENEFQEFPGETTIIPDLSPAPEDSRNDVPADGLPEVDEPPASEEEILLPEISPTPTPEIPYDELLTSLTTLSEDVAAMREVMEKNQEYYETYQNMGNVLIYGTGLLFGVICILILANYIRH